MHNTKIPPVAVIDIGSNNIRLGVYRGSLPLYNIHLESMRCGLGRDISHTGRLYPDGANQALQYIPYLYKTAQNIGCETIFAVATAALRNATDTDIFLHRLHKKCPPLDIEVISGEEEARLSAIGCIHRVSSPLGIVADLGGGSMDISAVQGDKIFGMTSIPVGALSLNKYPDMSEIKTVVKMAFKQHFCPKTFTGLQNIYVVGGIFRGIMCQYMRDTVPHMQQVSKSVRKQNLQDFCVPRMHMLKMLNTILKNKRSVYTLPDVGEVRYPYVMPACYMLKRLIKKSDATHIIACIGGVREGVFLDRIGIA